MNALIRKASPKDLPVLLQFEQELIGAERPLDETMIAEQFHYYDLAELIADDDAEVLVAEINGELVGSGSARIRQGKPYNTFKNYAFLGFMYVTPEHRGKGINQKIIHHLTKWASHKSLGEIRLQVYSDNIAAIKAYEKVGFKGILTEMRLTNVGNQY